jgi:hypothetical protein
MEVDDTSLVAQLHRSREPAGTSGRSDVRCRRRRRSRDSTASQCAVTAVSPAAETLRTVDALVSRAPDRRWPERSPPAPVRPPSRGRGTTFRPGEHPHPRSQTGLGGKESAVSAPVVTKFTRRSATRWPRVSPPDDGDDCPSGSHTGRGSGLGTHEAEIAPGAFRVAMTRGRPPSASAIATASPNCADKRHLGAVG